MDLTTHLHRLPRAFDPDLGRDAAARVPDITGPGAELIAGATGSSPYLQKLILREAAWLPGAMGDAYAAADEEMTALKTLEGAALRDGLRRAKRRLALLTALADLGGAWSLEQVTAMLTRFADLACDLLIKDELARLIRRGKLPGATEDDIADGAGLVVLAMGKMGAFELNYSSDIDLICLFDETRYDPETYHEVRSAMVKITRAMANGLSDRTGDGYVFRTDLRLRPDPAVTPVCIAMEAAERYYESLGRTWERAAYIKARPAAGDLAAGARFLDTLRPFVWRRHLDFAAIEDAHAIRQRIRETKASARARDVAGQDIKLGRGGIREIEFYTQTRQLIAGGRDPSLRVRGTVEGLAVLAVKGWVADQTASELQEHYRAHRTLEHRIQMVHDGHTHVLPKAPEDLARVACLMGLDVPDLLSETSARMDQVDALTEAFFAPAAPKAQAAENGLGEHEIVARWPSYPALRSKRAARIFERLKPDLLIRIAATAHPDQALRAMDGFLQGLPSGVQIFSLLDANPPLMDLLIDIAGTSPELSAYLSRNAAVLDSVIAGDFFEDWPGEDALRGDLARRLAAEPDYETQLDLTRGWQREWHFRIGVHHLRGLIPAAQAGRQYAELAGAVIGALLPVVSDEFAKKHGAPPGRGAAVLGMGSLGAMTLNSGSDLDIIVIYDPGNAEISDGRRPLATRTYYARLTQALITALTVPMRQGRLYAVDMRLRPSGNQGPVATSLAAFRQYQLDDAWVWEHLALTRARAIAGADGLMAELNDFRREVLTLPRPQSEILRELADMRARLAAAKPAGTIWQAKDGPGRLMDIELLATVGALITHCAARDVASGLAGAVCGGLLSEEEASVLSAHYALMWGVRAAMRLLAGGSGSAEPGPGGEDFLARSAGFVSGADLKEALRDAYARSEQIIEAAMERVNAQG